MTKKHKSTKMPSYRYPVEDWILYLRTYHKKRYTEDCESGKIEPVYSSVTNE